MRRPDRLGIVHGFMIAFAIALVGKAGYEQLYRGRYWSDIARRQQFTPSQLPASRGDIEDAGGSVLAESRELTHLRIAPQEVAGRDRATLARAMRAAHIDPRWIHAALDPRRRWVDIPTPFLPDDVAPVVAIQGVHPVPAPDRVYASSAGVRRLVGRVDPSGRPLDGVELSLDEVLRGDTGHVRIPHDKIGRRLGLPVGASEPLPGSTVILTIDRSLQDICEQALASAVDSLHASGGDIVVMNPRTGEVLAMASDRTDPRAVANTAVTEPYEPGSTVKPFVAARLLQLGRARPDETVQTFGGHFELNGRKIDDAEEHKPLLTLSEVIQHSSNVGIVRFAERLTPREKYELFRDIGFGAPTTIPLPAESPGTLRPPSRWSKQSEASVAMGYELSVTPLQVVTAYSAIANGGELLEPHIVKEVRAPTGEVRYTVQRRVVRRVMSPEVAATMRKMLRDVVSGGTSTKADLATLDVAGKSGTARRNVHGHYLAGSYTASFVGLFPNDNPQFVILVKLDNPQNGYYGGVLAGGVTNVILRAALSARDAALDLYTLSSSVHAPRPDTSEAGRAAARAKAHEEGMRAAAESARVRAAERRPPGESSALPRPAVPPPATPADTDPRTSASYVVRLPARVRIAPVAQSLRPVPNVTGLPLRAAVYALHSAGFRVEIVHGTPAGTTPAAGTALAPGRVVKLSSGTP